MTLHPTFTASLVYACWLALCAPRALPAQDIASNHNSHFGDWVEDDSGLPAFELNFSREELPWYPFSHIQGTGRNMVITNQWGYVDVLTTEYGLANLSPSIWHTRGGFYPMLKVKNTLISLIASELAQKKVTYGIGYTTFTGEVKQKNVHVAVTYRIITPFDDSKGFYATVQIRNMGDAPLAGELWVQSDIWIKPDHNHWEQWVEHVNASEKITETGASGFRHLDDHYAEIFLAGSDAYRAEQQNNTLRLAKALNLPPQGQERGTFRLSFNQDVAQARKKLAATDPDSLRSSWTSQVAHIDTARNEPWVNRELIWDHSQLLAFSFYDQSLEEHFIHLGGYGIGNDPAEPGNGFVMREIAETAIVLSSTHPALAQSSLRWIAKTQYPGGDLKRIHHHFPLEEIDTTQRLSSDFPNESDTEIWFLLALGEYYNATGDMDFFDQEVPYINQKQKSTLWERAKVTFSFIKNDIGTGPNGLVKMLKGDWNDYLSKIGEKGQGQSMMNTGMMCRALAHAKNIAQERNDPIYQEMDAFQQALQQAATASFDETQFVRAYDDAGNAIGGPEDRLFINAQSWAVLGKCGTAEQRRTALKSALDRCATPIGLTLMSKPYSSPTPINISWAPIPAGEGENAGIWPQTHFWMVWALAEEGMIELAQEQWQTMSLANHTRLYPQVPFGIYNGPDCYSSKYAHEREGWTQVATFNRMIPIPMNPMIAWQNFALDKINQHKE